MREGENEHTNIAVPKNQRQQVDALMAFALVMLQHARPRQGCEALDGSVERLPARRPEPGKDLGRVRNRCREGRVLDRTGAHMCADTPLVVGNAQHQQRARRRIELAHRLEQHVAVESAPIAGTSKPLDIRAQSGIRLGQLVHALLRRALALGTHCRGQSIPMQCGTDDAGGNLERRYHFRLEFTRSPAIIEADRPGVPAVHHKRHDDRALRATRGNAGRVLLVAIAGAQMHGLTGAQPLARSPGMPLVPGHTLDLAALAGHARRNPFAFDCEPARSGRVRFDDGQHGTIDPGRLAELAQHRRHHRHDLAGFQQPPAGTRRGREQLFAVRRMFELRCFSEVRTHG